MTDNTGGPPRPRKKPGPKPGSGLGRPEPYKLAEVLRGEIKRRREALKLTCATMAARMEPPVTGGMISYYQNSRFLDERLVPRIAVALKCKPEDLTVPAARGPAVRDWPAGTGLKYKNRERHDEAIRQVMEEAGRPMRLAEITEALAERGHGLPMTMNARLSLLIHAMKLRPDVFVKIEGRRGVYYLKDRMAERMES